MKNLWVLTALFVVSLTVYVGAFLSFVRLSMGTWIFAALFSISLVVAIATLDRITNIMVDRRMKQILG